MSNSLWPHRLQHTGLPCLSSTPRAYSISCQSSWWCHPTISSSVVLFSSCPQSLPASRSSPVVYWTPTDLGEGNGNPLQYSCLENPTDGGAWWATVHGVAKSQTWLSDFTFTDLEDSSFNIIVIFLAFYTAHVVLKPRRPKLLPFHLPVHHMWSELFRTTRPSSVTLHMAHISLSYTKVWSMWSICLVFCDYHFHFVCPLMDEDKRPV